MKRMNLGCGPIQPEGWFNVDRVAHEPVAAEATGGMIVADVLEGLPYEDGEFDIVVMNHSLQQIRIELVPAALQEVHRVLRWRGGLRVMVPDIPGACYAYSTGKLTWFPNADASRDTIDDTFTRYLTWYGTNVTCFTESSLARELKAGGFRHVGRAAHNQSPLFRESEILELDDRKDESIFMEAIA